MRHWMSIAMLMCGCAPATSAHNIRPFVITDVEPVAPINQVDPVVEEQLVTVFDDDTETMPADVEETPQVVAYMEPLQPRFPRVLFFSAAWCKPCQSSKAEWYDWLADAGWCIGEMDSDHIQIVDTDEPANKTRVKAYGVTHIPFAVLVRSQEMLDGGTWSMSRRGPVIGRREIVELLDGMIAK